MAKCIFAHLSWLVLWLRQYFDKGTCHVDLLGKIKNVENVSIETSMVKNVQNVSIETMVLRKSKTYEVSIPRGFASIFLKQSV